jgi:ADP-heptose:LPS heptosyltransferase
MLVEGIDATIVLTGNSGDRRYVESVRAGMRGGAVNLAGQTDLKTLAGVIKISNLVISCDSGPMHMACALGVPVTAVFGPTDPSSTGPYCENSKVVRAETRCAPCRKRRCAAMTCMNNVPVRDVYKGALEIFGGAPERN